MGGDSSKMFPDWMFPSQGEHDADGRTLADLFVQAPPPPLPDRLTPKILREAIAGVLARVSANELAQECVRFGLPPEEANEDGPWRGKWRYVERRIRHWMLPELLTLGRHVAAVYDDDRVLNHLLGLDGPGGVRGEMKNLIFAADGAKPKIVLRDAINNDLEIVENAEHCLIYGRPLADTGLTWRQLTAWWARSDSLADDEERAAAHGLYARLLKSMDRNGAERFVFERYCARYRTHGFDSPALIPQVYLHYDPYTRWTGKTLGRQRMDFLLLLDHSRRVVLELDGVQHYADTEGRANPARYAEMVAADRELRLAGYEVYRFGGYEIANRSKGASVLDEFFDNLLSDPNQI
jgi:very-short-patch-repair endonuclease